MFILFCLIDFFKKLIYIGKICMEFKLIRRFIGEVFKFKGFVENELNIIWFMKLLRKISYGLYGMFLKNCNKERN